MKKTVIFLCLFGSIFTLGAPLRAQAEYRVFLLKIYKKQNPQDFRMVESTLDHDQYPGYYHVANNEAVTYTDTWRCYGRTGDFKPHCPNPKGQIPGPASSAP